ncbi:MAG: DegT/DnrJ/EryC1/StrS family aminotransferase [Clostridium sp.]|uniref:DegT/DnrJ/EryC1/StrS family aminotransferase n=1 Tax=Clostridium sp. TaxID=1506 RepID=UPI002FC5CF24
MIEEKEIEAVVDTLKSNWLSKGPKTIEFEKRFAEYVGAKHAIAMNSCTAALHIALIANGIGEGDEVITTPLTFAASSNTIIHSGAVPVFVDIDEKTMCIDPDKIEEKITSKTKAIVPVHYAGQSCDLERIREIARRHNLLVLEDAAHAVYTTHKGDMIGSTGDTAAFSFYATKNICTGEGGMLTTNSDEVAEKARFMSLHGMSKNAWNRFAKGGSWAYDILYPGYKYNMTDMQAALGLCQLDKIQRMQDIRKEYADRYNEALGKLNEIITPCEVEGNRHAWHLYVIRIKEDMLTIDRNKFIECLAEENIGTSVHYTPVHLHPYYMETFGYKYGDFPVAEKAFEGMISLPLYPSMSTQDVEDVIDAVTRIVQEHRK